jgi:protein-L-isoaspartate(D-aspartate) O-methyltransferase
MQPDPALANSAAAAGIRDPRLLEAMRVVPRAGFVPAEHAEWASIDEPLPIGHGQVTTQPSLVAAMIESLELQGSEIVLEVGTGFGYQTALLAHLARFVWSVEWWPDLAAAARASVDAAGIANVEIVTGDGSAGLPQHAPFDAIIVSAAFPAVPQPLVDQLVSNGRLVQPIGPGGDEDVVLFERRGSTLRRMRSVTLARFVRLVGAHGFAA